jgi:CPA1 family monovalent cation:H+ antiporter
MDTVTTVLTLLVAIVVGGTAARGTRLPLPLVQVALGAVIAVSPVPTVELRPELFFLLFLPPLLFLDGWRIPKDELFRDRATVLELAIGLVVLTVVGVGWLIHRMIPAMPLPVAFALAAVISPTDPIAVSAIAARAPIPKRLMHILEGESLLNDASGLVCLRFAVAAMLTGAFSLHQAVLTFLWLAIGGAVIGSAVTIGVTRVQRWAATRLGVDTSAHIVVSLLIPFAAYILAEELHCSGILAAVAAGIAMTFGEQSGPTAAVTRVRRAGVWDTVQFVANGVIFVLLGEQMPGLLAKADETVRASGHQQWWWLAVYVLVISLALGVTRFLWVWASLRLTLFRAGRRGEAAPRVSLRLVAATSLAGVRGAVTLAGVLTLPVALNDGSPFPARDLAIFLAAGVIVFSLVVASIGLPRMLKGLHLPPEPTHQVELGAARVAAAEAAIRAVEAAQHRLAADRPDADLYAEASARVMEPYRARILAQQQTSDADDPRAFEAAERELRLVALRAERAEIFRRAKARELPEEQARRLVREIDLLEARYAL